MLAAMCGAKQCAAQTILCARTQGIYYFIILKVQGISILTYSRAVHGLFDELKLDIAHRDGVALLYTHLPEFCNHAFFAQNLLEIRH